MTPNRRTFLRQLGWGAAGLSVIDFTALCHAAGRTVKLPRATPEAAGVASAGIQSFLDAVAQSRHELHSFILARHGRVLAEGWWSPYAPVFNHTLYSLSKSFTSTAVGFAVAEGKLRVNDRVVSFFPDDLPAARSDNLAALRVRDLLTMSVGNEKEPTLDMVATENWVRTFLAAPITHPPGSTFMYNSGATYMLSAIVQQRTGQRVIDYLAPRLFQPLGIEGPAWETCPRGINTGGWGLSVQTESLAKFAQWYLQQGSWNGRQLLPASWIDEATTFKIQQPLPARPGRPNERNDWLQGYGYQFWRCTHHGFRGDGAFGQYAVVLPEQDAVIAITGESSDMQGELDLVWEHLLPALKPGPLPADRAAEAQLRQTLASLALKRPAGPSASPRASQVSGANFKFDTNNLGLESVSFHFAGREARLVFRDGQTEHPVVCSLSGWARGETALPGTPPRLISGGAPRHGTKSKVAVAGAWKDENTFEMIWRYYETPHHDTVTCHFDDGGVRLAFMSSIAGMSPTPRDRRPELQGRRSA